MAIPITEITDHSTAAKARHPGWLISATNLRAFVDVLTGPVQVVEALFNEILNELSIDTAVGVQLDVIGKILGLPRTSAGEADSEYRIRLYGQTAALAASGEPEAVIGVWLTIWGANSVLLAEFQPAAIELTAFVDTDPDDPAQDAVALATMERVIAGGVGASFAIVEEPAFLWGNDADADANGDLPASVNGWGDDADADANGDISSGVGPAGNLARVL